MALMSDVLFGPQRDVYFRVYDPQMRSVDLGAVERRPDAILVEGEEAFDIDNKNWLRSLRALNANPTKRYTIRVDGPYGNYIVQFDTLDMFQGLSAIPQWLDLRVGDYLRDFHEGAHELDYSLD